MSGWTKFRDNYLGPSVTVLGAVTGQEWLAGLGAAYTAERQAKQAQKEQERREKQQHEYDLEMLHENQNFASPVTQAELMRKAGYNPFVAGSEGMLNAPSSSMGTSSSLPSSGMPYPNFTETVNGSMSALRDFADSVDKLSHSDLTKQQKTDLVETAFSRYKKIENEADMSDMDRQIKEIDLEFEQNYGHELRRNKFQKIKNEMDLIFNEAQNAVEQGNLLKAETALTEAKKKTEDEVSKLKGKEREMAEARARRIQEFLDGELNVMRSEVNRNNTIASATMLEAKANARKALADAIGQEKLNDVLDEKMQKELDSMDINQLDTFTRMIYDTSKFDNSYSIGSDNFGHFSWTDKGSKGYLSGDTDPHSARYLLNYFIGEARKSRPKKKKK